jgi:hypothetical protein
MKNYFLGLALLIFFIPPANAQCGFYCGMGDAINACTLNDGEPFCPYRVGNPIYFSDAGGSCSSVQFTVYKWNGSCYCTFVAMITTDGGSWTPTSAQTYLVTGPAGTGGGCPAASIYIGVGGVLPVELLSFTGKQENEKIILNWSTASEMNNDYFTIERSPDGNNWEVIGNLKGTGTTSTPRDYTFADALENTGSKTVYYRLKQTDFNGQYEYFRPVSVTINPPEFTIHPTVSSGLFFASTSENIREIHIYSALGEQVYIAGPQPSSSIDISSQPNGIYILRIKTEKSLITQKIIIQK